MTPSPRGARLGCYFACSIGFSLLVVCTTGLVVLPGLLLVAVAFTLTPVLWNLVTEETANSELPTLVSVLAPAGYVSYLYAIQMRVPVGFTDVNVHLVQALTLFGPGGSIDFSHAQTLSFNFVGLYVMARFYALATSTGIVSVATYLPPMISIAGVCVIYAFMRRIFPKKVALLAITFVAWDNVVVVFGSGFITQTPAFLMLFLALYLYLLRRTQSAPPTGVTVATILSLMALATFSFASAVIGLFLFGSIGILESFGRVHRYQRSVAFLSMLTIFLLAYVIYISGSPAAVFGGMAQLVEQALASQPATAPSLGQQIYGPFVYVISYSFWGLFIVFLPMFFTGREFRTNPLVGVTLLSCGVVLAIGILLGNAIGFSLARTYEIGLIPISIVVTSGLLHLVLRAKPKVRRAAKVAVCLLVVAVVASSAVKLPTYIVGNTSPLRQHSPIDDIPYWSAGPAEFSAAQFLQSYGVGATLHEDTLIEKYMFLDLCYQSITCGLASFGPNGTIIASRLHAGDLIVLENSFNGGNYAYRVLLPPESAYSSFSTIYDNGDYELFLV